jgi:hypothetical protein
MTRSRARYTSTSRPWQSLDRDTDIEKWHCATLPRLLPKIASKMTRKNNKLNKYNEIASFGPKVARRDRIGQEA